MSTELSIRLTPRADRDAVVGLRDDGVLLVRVSAPPVDGRANTALCRLLAKALKVPPSSVRVVRGEASREKVVRVDGLSAADAHERLRR